VAKFAKVFALAGPYGLGKIHGLRCFLARTQRYVAARDLARVLGERGYLAAARNQQLGKVFTDLRFLFV
jgi:hypothetical protein